MEFFVNPDHFGGAQRDGDALWFTADLEQHFGLVVGPAATPLPEWRACLVVDSSWGERAGSLVRRGEWDFYAQRCAAHAFDVEVIADDVAISGLLSHDAPQSSSWPGDDNIVAWYGINDGPRLVAVAALTRWRSGRYVVSSVATAADHRGRGLAHRVVRSLVGAAHSSGVDWLGLGVARANVVAQNVYRDTGFIERARFTRYAGPED